MGSQLRVDIADGTSIFVRTDGLHTAAPPPNHGRMIFAIIGCTWKSRKALTKMVRA